MDNILFHNNINEHTAWHTIMVTQKKKKQKNTKNLYDKRNEKH